MVFLGGLSLPGDGSARSAPSGSARVAKKPSFAQAVESQAVTVYQHLHVGVTWLEAPTLLRDLQTGHRKKVQVGLGNQFGYMFCILELYFFLCQKYRQPVAPCLGSRSCRFD